MFGYVIFGEGFPFAFFVCIKKIKAKPVDFAYAEIGIYYTKE